MCVIADESIFNQAIHHTGILTGRLLKSDCKPFPSHNGSVRILFQGPNDHSFTAGRGMKK